MMTSKRDDLILGIDLGTTNTVFAIANTKQNGDIVAKVVEVARPTDAMNDVSGKVRLIPSRKATLPSCVFYREENGFEPIVGDFAKSRYALRPNFVSKSIKSQMANLKVSNLDSEIPDKTPSQISARILKHGIKEIEKLYHTTISEAVITVPANFDAAMCQATKEAARLAGIKVVNEDMSERAILLSEPNAVVYDLINQIQNGELASCVLNLDSPKNVLVFDLGGGTLDITLHNIARRETNKDTLKVNEIATNRYTLLGGDDFDMLIAQEMYERLLKQYSAHKEVVNTIRKEKERIMSQLLIYAEQLKIEVNESSSNDYYDDWGYDDETSFNVGGTISAIGYAYDDEFTKEEIEQLFNIYMANHLQFEDYKRIDMINDKNNIIYPILDVLNKAKKKMQDEVVVDAVILNGGMSKYYLIQDRLRQFFNLEPITALDPDLSVAKGAAIYHYYLRQNEELEDDMIKVGNAQIHYHEQSNKVVKEAPRIEWGKKILNDDLYLGMRQGATQLLISEGSELPYESEMMKGFAIKANQKILAIPIRVKDNNGCERTIAKGVIKLNREYNFPTYISFKIFMSVNKVLTMKALVSTDIEASIVLEEVVGEIACGDTSDNNANKKIEKINAPLGHTLRAKNEINRLKDLCQRFEQCKVKHKTKISEEIREMIKNIVACANPQDFSDVIIEQLNTTNCIHFKERLLTIGRKLAIQWSRVEKNQFANCCYNILIREIKLASSKGPMVNVNNQAIYAFSVCGNHEWLAKIERLKNNPKYRHACLYTFAKCRYDIDFLYQVFKNDVYLIKEGYEKTGFCQSAYALSNALHKVSANEHEYDNNISKVINEMIDLINLNTLNHNELVCAIIALGMLGDRRNELNSVSYEKALEIVDFIDGLKYLYPSTIIEHTLRATSVSKKMLFAEKLSNDEEQFLLQKIEIA